MFPYSPTFRGHPERNGRSLRSGDHHFLNNRNSNPARGHRNRPRHEREQKDRQTQDRARSPYNLPRQRSGLDATMQNVYAANDADRRERCRARRHSNVDNLASEFVGFNMGSAPSRRNRSGHNVRRHDQQMPAAPEPPRVAPRNAEYYLDRACRPSISLRDNYNDAHQYINGQRPRRYSHDATRHDPREYAHLNLRFEVDGSRHHDPNDTFCDRLRRRFRRRRD